MVANVVPIVLRAFNTLYSSQYDRLESGTPDLDIDTTLVSLGIAAIDFNLDLTFNEVAKIIAAKVMALHQDEDQEQLMLDSQISLSLYRQLEKLAGEKWPEPRGSSLAALELPPPVPPVEEPAAEFDSTDPAQQLAAPEDQTPATPVEGIDPVALVDETAPVDDSPLSPRDEQALAEAEEESEDEDAVNDGEPKKRRR